jgi:hypothetical protein
MVATFCCYLTLFTTDTLHKELYTSYLAEFLFELEMFHAKVAEKIKTQIL